MKNSLLEEPTQCDKHQKKGALKNVYINTSFLHYRNNRTPLPTTIYEQ